MSSEYRNNHYVPVWYQKRFVIDPLKDTQLYRLKLKPEEFTNSKGLVHTVNPLRKMSFSQCFSEDDLYTSNFRNLDPKGIEKYFFGKIDILGKKGVEWCENFKHPWDGTDGINELLLYMSVQKLRTPKGLEWLHAIAKKKKNVQKDHLLFLMTQLRQLYCALWMESVWLIADATKSETKFIISDHPVTVYNRRCPPDSYKCKESNDPDTSLHGTHTIFPLSLNKVLILTNLSWVRNPYQNELDTRPNPSPFRSAMMKITDIQTLRFLTEQEVREINYIIKYRAYNFVAAAKEEWLFPEKFVSAQDWKSFGRGYLLMPDPRGVVYGGQMLIGHKDGTASAFDEYGRVPGQPGYKGFGDESDKVDMSEWGTFHRFQGEFARLFGPYRRGRAADPFEIDNERDSDDFHQYHLRLENECRGK